jgi:sortase (surface protein transpeptidase)
VGRRLVSRHRRTRRGQQCRDGRASRLLGCRKAVFYHVWELEEGDEIDVTGEDQNVYKYSVDWVRNYTIADLDAKGVQEIVGATKTEKLTLITCGGDFDYDKGEYKERIVIRSSIVTA